MTTKDEQNMRALVGTLWMHSEKGIKRGGDPKRIFSVVDAFQPEPGDNRWYLLAWKNELHADGRLLHAHDDWTVPRSHTDKLFWFNGTTSNLCQPTAIFRPDSLYVQVDPQLLSQIALRLFERKQVVNISLADKTFDNLVNAVIERGFSMGFDVDEIVKAVQDEGRAQRQIVGNGPKRSKIK
jgi:hypothetical protein